MLRSSNTRASDRGSPLRRDRHGPVAHLEATIPVLGPHQLGGEHGEELSKFRRIAVWLCLDCALQCLDKHTVGPTDPREESAIDGQQRRRLATGVTERGCQLEGSKQRPPSTLAGLQLAVRA